MVRDVLNKLSQQSVGILLAISMNMELLNSISV